jgi:hypothetical protein
VASLSLQARRIVVVGAFAVVAAAAPVLALSAAPAPSAEAAPKCLAWFGNKEDGNCLSTSNGSGVGFGSPNIGVCNGGICTGPLMPGNSWNINVPVG